MTRQNLVLILLAVAISILPLFIFSDGSAEFSGADGQAEGIIQESHPTYEPWAAPLWEPPTTSVHPCRAKHWCPTRSRRPLLEPVSFPSRASRVAHNEGERARSANRPSPDT